MGNSVGYLVKYLKDLYKYLDIIFTDNKQIIYDLQKEFGFTNKTISKFSCLYYPHRDMDNKELYYLNRDLSEIINTSNRPAFLWAGRICDQKRPDLLFKISESNPHIDFIVYGYVDQDNIFYDKLKNRNNVVFKGPYDSFSEILDKKFIGLLYTSSWDGLPNVLIEACAVALPVIASSVGGIKELINETTGYLIEDIESINDYSTALNDILKNPEEATRRGNNAYNLIKTRHSFENIEDSLIKCGYLA
jgi:glycosyltransferase involved in cell wall biosynthesis